MTAPNPESILDTVKKVLGLLPDVTAFDLDIVMHINGVIGSLWQFGVTSDASLAISDNTTLWSAITARQDILNLIRPYMFMRVKFIFDPPASGFAISAMTQQIQQFEWRLVSAVETTYAGPTVNGNWWVLDGLSDFPPGALIGDFGIDFPTGDVYSNGTDPGTGFWWDLTGLSDFPSDAAAGDFGYDTTTGSVWRNA